MHEKYASPTKSPGGPRDHGSIVQANGDDAAMVIATKSKLFSLADDSDSD